VSEHQSTDGRFVILVTQNQEGVYRAYQFTWFTNADDDPWGAFWMNHALGIITDQDTVIIAEVDRRLLEYEKSLSNSHSNGETKQLVDDNPS
jgi:hypothetical protein